ncbi:MAG: TIGR01777 family oxidoreductase [Bacteroidales bacterium]
MKALIFGGSGFIGKKLVKQLVQKDHKAVIVTRNKSKISQFENKNISIVEWDYSSPISFTDKDFDVIINLAGKSIGSKRWSKKVKNEIIESRINSTKKIVEAINNSILKTKTFINASAAGYYGNRKDEPLNETGKPGNDFLAGICINWEKEAYKVTKASTRIITLRTGVVIGEEGAIKKMVLPYKFFAGGPLGSGKQYLSWIYINDLVKLILFIINNKQINGPVNATAPYPVKMNEFSKTLAKVLKKPSWIRVPEYILRITLGQMSETITHGQNAIPEKTSNAGFKFQFPTIKTALKDLLN